MKRRAYAYSFGRLKPDVQLVKRMLYAGVQTDHVLEHINAFFRLVVLQDIAHPEGV